jgi:hypothetical protein
LLQKQFYDEFRIKFSQGSSKEKKSKKLSQGDEYQIFSLKKKFFIHLNFTSKTGRNLANFYSPILQEQDQAAE